jgi:hypothetical protein
LGSLLVELELELLGWVESAEAWRGMPWDPRMGSGIALEGALVVVCTEVAVEQRDDLAVAPGEARTEVAVEKRVGS